MSSRSMTLGWGGDPVAGADRLRGCADRGRGGGADLAGRGPVMPAHPAVAAALVAGLIATACVSAALVLTMRAAGMWVDR